MIYNYKCNSCKKETPISKPMSQCSRIEHCDECKTKLSRVYNSSAIKTSDGFKG